MTVINLQLGNMLDSLSTYLVPKFYENIDTTTDSNSITYNFYNNGIAEFKIKVANSGSSKAVDFLVNVNGIDEKIGIYFASDNNDNELYIFDNNVMFLISAVNSGYNFPFIINKTTDLYYICPCSFYSTDNIYKYAIPKSGTGEVMPITVFANDDKYTYYYTCNNVHKNTGISVLNALSYNGELLNGIYLPFCRQFNTYEDGFVTTLLNNKKYFYTNFIIIEV